ncbi:MAG: tetratricopeptide repeat protein [Planctomycetota bacterium]
MPSIEQLEALLQKDPDDVFLNFGLAMQLTREQRYEEGLARFDRVIGLDPNYIAAYHQKAQTLVKMRNLKEAKRTLAAGITAAERLGNKHARSEMQELLDSLSLA